MPRRRLCPERGFALYAGGFALVLGAIMALLPARQKRERELQVIDSLLDSGCPVSKLLRTHLHKAGDVEGDEQHCSQSTLAKRISQQLHSVDSIQTPYGRLIQDMEVPCDGEQLKLAYINPFALLYYGSGLGNCMISCAAQFQKVGGGSLCTQMKSVQAMA